MPFSYNHGPLSLKMMIFGVNVAACLPFQVVKKDATSIPVEGGVASF